MDIKKSSSLENFIQRSRSAVLTDFDREMYAFASEIGVTIDSHVFKILLELIRLDVPIDGVMDILHCTRRLTTKYKRSSVPVTKEAAFNKGFKN